VRIYELANVHLSPTGAYEVVCTSLRKEVLGRKLTVRPLSYK